MEKKFDETAYIHQIDLSKYFEDGENPIEKEQEYLELTEFSALNGNVEYLVQMGMIYKQGMYKREIDHELALEYFNEAVNLESPKAYALLGTMYQSGLGVPKDVNRAIELYQTAIAKVFPFLIRPFLLLFTYANIPSPREMYLVNISWESCIWMEPMLRRTTRKQ